METGNDYVSQSIHQGAEREGHAADRRGYVEPQGHYARRDQGNLVLHTESLGNIRRDGLGSPSPKAPHHSKCFLKLLS